MKLLQINTTLNWGSTGKIAEHIGLLVMDEAGESYIAHNRNYTNPSRSQSIAMGGETFARAACSFYNKFDRHGLASHRATRKLIRKIKQIKPDIIHLHNIHGRYVNYKILFRYLRSVDTPVVWTLHDCWTFTGHCAHYAPVGCEKWKSLCHHCPQLGAYPAAKYADNSKGNFLLKKRLFTSIADRLTLVPVSEWLGEQAQESFFGTSGCHIKVINNGIDTATFTPTPCDDLNENYDINGRKVLLGVAMPWSKQKGFNDFIALRGMLPMEEYAIVLVGVSPEQKQSLPEGIIGIESTHNAEELAKWYSRADALLALSKAETFGLTVVEALSCGTPAIVYNTTALPKLTTPETGVAVELGNLEQLKCAVEEVTSRGKEFYGEACRKRAVEMFDQKSCYDKYISLYHDLLK